MLNLAILSSEIVPARNLNSLYIILDIMFLLFFMCLLVYKKRHLTAIFAFSGGILYFLVDYGLFYLVLGTREVNGANPFWFLLWLSLSYGITNFAWIWLCLKKDEHLLEWLVLIVSWWICCPLIVENFGGSFSMISISRGTTKYHGIMAIFLVVGYTILCIYNMITKKQKINISRLMIIGITVQFGWEFSLLITGIRPNANNYLNTLIINSLVETNMGLPYLYLIYLFITKRYHEDLVPKESIDEQIFVSEPEIAYNYSE